MIKPTHVEADRALHGAFVFLGGGEARHKVAGADETAEPVGVQVRELPDQATHTYTGQMIKCLPVDRQHKLTHGPELKILESSTVRFKATNTNWPSACSDLPKTTKQSQKRKNGNNLGKV